MAAHATIHPSADALRAFALGKLNDSTAAALMNHLDCCPDCCKIVAALSGDDFLDRLRQARSHSSTPAPAKAHSETAAGAKPSPSQPAIANLPPELANNPQYEILRELGRGGMGVVYLAKNKLMDRFEVLKVINKTLLDHAGAVERFLREIRSAAKLSHANVVGAYSALQVGELLAFAMEYVEGQDLASLVKSQGPLPVPHACFYVQQAALGLQHAFEKGMVHRDIKPQNLILAREGKKHIVKVLDFGLAKVIREKTDDTGLTGEGKMLGTPDYIAPEQTMDAAHADIRADIYSLGCTLYYLLSGHPPFSASSLGAILVAHQMHEAKPLNLERPEVPEELAAVVRKMMAKSPAQRYQTPREVVQALSPFVKQGASSKSSPALSSGPAGLKQVVKKVAPVDPAAAPAAEEVQVQPEPAEGGELSLDAGNPPAGSRRREKFSDLTIGSRLGHNIPNVTPRKGRSGHKHRAATVRERTTQRKWLISGGIGVGVLLLALLGMWAAGVFKVKTKDGTIVLENLPSNTVVLVDGERVTVHWGDGGKRAEIRVKPGNHKVEVKKGDLLVDGKELTLNDGGSEIFTVRLLPNNPDIPDKPNAKGSEPPPESPPPPPDRNKPDAPRVANAADGHKGFKPLFNGKDLTGWKTHPRQPGSWRVENGVLIGSGDGASHLYTNRGDYTDFHLRLEARLNVGSGFRSTGVYFRAPFGPNQPANKPTWIAVYNAKIDADRLGGLYDGANSELHRMRAPVLRPDEWITFEIIAEGNHFVIKVNGQTTSEYTDAQWRFKKGHLVLQQHSAATVAEFRKIEIEELLPPKSESPPQVSLPADASVDRLCQALKDKDPDLRKQAATLLAERGSEAAPALNDLAETLSDAKNPDKVRVAAASALAIIAGKIHDKAKPVAPALAQAIKASELLEVRRFAADALGQMRFPANESAIPAILDTLEHDTDASVRLRCIFALFKMDQPQFRDSGGEKLLIKLLDERSGGKMAPVRYEAARKLAWVLRNRAPEKTVDVLLEMLTNKTLVVYNNTDVKVIGGRSEIQENLDGDARHLAARALGWLGKKASGRKNVRDALKAAAKDANSRLREEATAALNQLGIP